MASGSVGDRNQIEGVWSTERTEGVGEMAAPQPELDAGSTHGVVHSRAGTVQPCDRSAASEQSSGASSPAACAPGPSRSLSEVTDCRDALMTLSADDLRALDDDARLALLRQLEELTRSAAAVSARLQVDFRDSQMEQQQAAGVPRSRRGKAVADELAHARMTSPYWGSRELSSARALVEEMPQTLAALTGGKIGALQARAVTEATTCLSVEDRAEVDRRLAPRLPGSSTQEITGAARSLVYEIDPAAYVARARRAAQDRGVSVRPAPDVMARLSAHLPAHQAVACYAALRTHATAARASGDPRGLNQLMADELHQRLTGRAVVDGIDIEVGLVITDQALFGGASDAAELEGYGPVPAEVARQLLRPEDAVGDGNGGGRGSGDRGDGVDGRGSSRRRGDRGGDGRDCGSSSRRDGGSGPGGSSASEELCPESGRCTDASCDLLHGPPLSPPAHPGFPAPPAASPPSRPVPPHATDSPAHESPDASRPAPSCEPDRDPEPTAERREAVVWLRRLWVDPVSHVLVEQDSRRRRFTGELRRFVISRDRTCRNRWCGAPIRDVDHVVRHSDDGATTAGNGRGLCHRCNLARERHRHRPAHDHRSAPPLLPSLEDSSARPRAG